MRELIERLEKAEGPDRVLDQDVWHALGLCQPVRINGEIAGCADYHAPRFTASLDSALSLVPEGWLWQVLGHGEHSNALVQAPYDIAGDDLAKFKATVASSPAIALVIAALKARLQMSPPSVKACDGGKGE
jgi:hypothetical protein